MNEKLIECGNLSEERIHKIRKLFQWLRQLQHYLLEKTKADQKELSSFHSLILEIWRDWKTISEDKFFLNYIS